MSGTGVRRPEGNPEGVRGKAKQVNAMFGRLDGYATSLGTARTTTQAALPVMRVQAFSSATKDVIRGVRAAATAMPQIASALTGYASALDEAQIQIDYCNQEFDRLQQQRTKALHDDDLPRADELQRQMRQQRNLAEQAETTYKSAARHAAHSMNGVCETWAPGSSSSAAVDAWAGAAAAISQSGADLDIDGVKESYKRLNERYGLAKESLSNFSKAGSKGYQLVTLGQYVRLTGLTRRAQAAEQLALKAFHLGLDDLAAGGMSEAGWAKLTGTTRTLAAAMTDTAGRQTTRANALYKMLRGPMGEARALERALKVFPGASPTAVQQLGKLGSKLAPITRITGPAAAKIFGPLGMLTGGMDIASAISKDNLKSTDSKIKAVGGLGSLTAGGATTLMALGVVGGPVTLAVVAGGSLVAAGAWAYENREAIKKYSAKAWNYAKDVARTAVSLPAAAVTTVADKAIDVGKGAVDAGKGAVNLGKKAWHGVFG